MKSIECQYFCRVIYCMPELLHTLKGDPEGWLAAWVFLRGCTPGEIRGSVG
jgi:hypothetical protein